MRNGRSSRIGDTVRGGLSRLAGCLHSKPCVQEVTAPTVPCSPSHTLGVAWQRRSVHALHRLTSRISVVQCTRRIDRSHIWLPSEVCEGRVAERACSRICRFGGIPAIILAETANLPFTPDISIYIHIQVHMSTYIYMVYANDTVHIGTCIYTSRYSTYAYVM